jgi:hypothetical protein
MITIAPMKRVVESGYPITFRQKEAQELGAHLRNHNSVVLVGMKRVGISNFLRFFLYHDKIDEVYIHNGLPQLFIHVDLNDLIERNLSAFWTLLLTRLVDGVQRSDLPEAQKRECRKLFVQSIQLKDHFFTVDSLRKVLEVLTTGGVYPTLFLLRFDRLSDVVTPEFFANILGLHEAVKHKVSMVFTSHRPLSDIAPDVFTKSSLSVFSKDMYLPTAPASDMGVILETLEGQYNASFEKNVRDALIEVSGGYVQYLQLAVIRLHQEKSIPATAQKLTEILSKDEQIALQSEELFESLTKKEKEILLSVSQGNSVSKEERQTGEYLWNTGIIVDDKETCRLFSPLFASYVENLSSDTQSGKELTKKEHILFTFLQSHEGELCERDAIIEAVWAENKDLGVSDWAIDRLIARLRSKLKAQGSPYQVVTVVTRGYKLTKV